MKVSTWRESWVLTAGDLALLLGRFDAPGLVHLRPFNMGAHRLDTGGGPP